MKIITIVRVRDEAKNIGRFIESYLKAGVDEIIVSDGGSEDNTVEIAKKYPKTKVLHYNVRVPMQNGLWRNPNGAHWNFLIDHAISDGADWILHEDADSFPTKDMQTAVRSRLEEATKNNIKVAMAYRIYMWGEKQYFPDLNIPGQGLWAFTADSRVRFSDHPWNTELLEIDVLKNVYNFEKPEALLHCFCPDIETTEKKMKFYRDSGEIPGYQHPLKSCGKLANIEPWMVA